MLLQIPECCQKSSYEIKEYEFLLFYNTIPLFTKYVKQNNLNIDLSDEEKSATWLTRFSKNVILEPELRIFMDKYHWYPSDVGDWGEVQHYQKHFTKFDTTVYLFIEPRLNDHYHYKDKCRIEGIVFSKNRYSVSIHKKRYLLAKVDKELLNHIIDIFQNLTATK